MKTSPDMTSAISDEVAIG